MKIQTISNENEEPPDTVRKKQNNLIHYETFLKKDENEKHLKKNKQNVFTKIIKNLGQFVAKLRPNKKNNDSFRVNLENQLLKFENQTDGSISPSERDILRNILDFGDVRLCDIMVPRADIVSIEYQKKLYQCFDLLKKSGYSRILVYKKELDQPVGMIHIKNLVSLIDYNYDEQQKTNKDKNTPPIKSEIVTNNHSKLKQTIEEAGLMREVLFVPPSMSAANLLLLMQSKSTHMAVVIDEYGGTYGIVTMENLVEEIIGGVIETNTMHEEEIKNISDHELDISARLAPGVVADIIGQQKLKDSVGEDIDTIGGVLSSMIGRVPTRGELIQYNEKCEFEVLEADPRKIKKLRVRLRENKSV